MSFEVDVKYRVDNHGQETRKLLEMMAVAGGTVDQEDTYLSHPARDFAVTNEAFRIRRLGDENRITYKGPRRSGPTKTREEIEIPFQAGKEPFEKLHQLFENLGFRSVATIRKRRETFWMTFQGIALEIALDLAKGLGEFVEIEAFAAGEADLNRAQSAVLALAAELGLTEVEPRSYLRMVLEAQQAAQARG
jgi:adenylate cyclase, class 2